MAMSNKGKHKKQLLNSVEDCVDEMLEGVLAINPTLKLLEGPHRVVVGEDMEDVKASGKVAVLAGGGSGHEPFAAGYVGRGMLTAAVAGPVFTSPPSNCILAAIRAITGPAGTLVIVANYTGDRLNFGMAIERARAEGLYVETVVVSEDCALTSTDKTAGRRGLCGYVVMQKIAGALAEEGKSLAEILSITRETAKSMGTIGISTQAPFVPGSGQTFQIQDNTVELGLGVHGEQGVKRIKISTADELVKTMIDHMTNPQTSTHYNLNKGDKVAAIINNLGATSGLEFFVMTRSIIKYLEQVKGAQVERVVAGHLMTSLDMSGLSLTLLSLDNDNVRKRCLDQETNATSWPKNFPSINGSWRSEQPRKIFRPPAAVDTKGFPSKNFPPDSAVPQFKTENNPAFLKSLESVCRSLISKADILNDYDKQGGDGDCGFTLKTGCQGILKDMDKISQLSTFDALLYLASLVESTMGGSSGALYGLFLTSAAKEFGGANEERTAASSPQMWCRALKAGIDSVSRYGGAEKGDRTMLDPLIVAYDSFRDSDTKNISMLEAFEQAVLAAEKEVDATLKMKAQAGRASYVSSNLLEKPDPGAAAVGFWLRAIYEALASN